LALKSNNQQAYAAVKEHLHQPIEHQGTWRTAAHCFDAFDDSHGRTVRRRVGTITDLTALPELTQWPDLQAVIAGATIRMAPQHAPVTSDDRFYIASVTRSATACVAMMRQPWDIENKLPWSLAVTCNDDRCRIRKEYAPANVAGVRHMALNLLRQEHAHQMSLSPKRLLGSLDEPYLLTVLSGATSDALPLPLGAPLATAMPYSSDSGRRRLGALQWQTVQRPWVCPLEQNVREDTAPGQATTGVRWLCAPGMHARVPPYPGSLLAGT